MRSSKYLLIALVVITAFATFASTASAANFCAGASPNCTSDPGHTFNQDANGIKAAILAASGSSDDNVVFIAADTYTIDSTTFPALSASTKGLSIVGAGVGQTILNGTSGGSPLTVLQLQRQTDSLSGFTLNVDFTSSFGTGIDLTRGTITNFAINQTTAISLGGSNKALEVRAGTTVSDGAVSTQGNVSGASFFYGAAVLRRVSFLGDDLGTGVRVGGTGDATLSKLRIVGYGLGLWVLAGNVEITDSLIDTQGLDSSNLAFFLHDQNTGTASAISVMAARNTIVGTGGAKGIYMYTSEAIDSISGSFSDMLVYDNHPSAVSWVCSQFAGSAVAVSQSGLATNVAPQAGGGCTVTSPPPSTATLTSSPFMNLDGGDFRPKWDSPIVDAGGTTNQSGGNDLGGVPRVVDGDNDGTATVDIGAFEYQNTVPAGAISAPASATSGLPVAFSHSMVDPDTTNSIASVTWNFGDGGNSVVNAPSHTYAAAGTYTVTVSATNLAGSIGTATATVVVAPPTLLPPPAALPSVKVTSKPKNSFNTGKSGVAIAKKGAISFSVTFSNAVKAKFTLQKVGKKNKLKSLKGSQTLRVATNAAKLGFGGVWNKKKLSAGRYRVTITPLAADGSAGKPVTVNLKLKK